jgi:UDP-3-O-[3-hydroxymyristoyl] glucosamine N-acyltransferase
MANIHPTARIAESSIVEDTVKIGENVKIGAFVSVKSGVVIGDNTKIEDGSRIYDNVIIKDNCIIGANVVIRPNVMIGNNTIVGTLTCIEGDVTVGNFTTIYSQCHITRGMKIGNNVFIGPFFVSTNTKEISYGKHGVYKNAQKKPLPSTIGDNTRIGASVSIAPGVTIGESALIDMETFVVNNVPSNAHVRGGKDKVGKIVSHIAK